MIEPTEIALPKPPEHGVLVIERPLSNDQVARVQEEFRRAFREDRWPVVLSGVGAAYWLDKTGTS